MLSILALITSLRLSVAERFESEKGAAAAEYGLILAFIALAIIVGVTLVGTNLNAFFNDLGTAIGNW